MIKSMKRGLLFLGFLVIVAGVRVPPCSAVGGMTMDCCPASSAAIAAPFTACCQEERGGAPTAALTKALHEDAVSQPLTMVAIATAQNPAHVSKIISLHEIGPPKNPTYIMFSSLLL